MIRANRGVEDALIPPHTIMHVVSDNKYVMLGFTADSRDFFMMPRQIDTMFRHSVAGAVELLERAGESFLWLDRGVAVNTRFIAGHRVTHTRPHIKAVCVMTTGREFGVSRYKTPGFLAHMAQKAEAA